MYVVTVAFDVLPESVTRFRQEVVANAQQSLTQEAGCLQFDVCVDALAPGRVFLYEVYVTKADFDAHLLAPHFLRFNEVSAPWVASKQVQVLSRLHPAA